MMEQLVEFKSKLNNLYLNKQRVHFIKKNGHIIKTCSQNERISTICSLLVVRLQLRSTNHSNSSNIKVTIQRCL